MAIAVEYYRDVCLEYALGVLYGKIIACKYVKLACQRFFEDLERAEADSVDFPYVWKPELGAKICSFLERMPHVKGPLAAKRELLRLSPWQVFIRMNVFGWVRRDTGFRRFTRVYETVARKAGKSSVVAATALGMLTVEQEEGAEIYALATKIEQAGIVWRIAKSMLNKTPGLREQFNLKVMGGEGKTNAVFGAIMNQGTNGIFSCRPGNPGDGDNPSFVVVDEYHEHRTSEGYDAMYNGMGTREQPLIWVITTAGYDLKVPCYEQQKYAEQMLMGNIKDENLFAIIYTLDQDDDPFDEKVWIKSNPNLGVSVSYENLREAAQEAKNNPGKMNTFLTKRMNIWTKSGVSYYSMEHWNACGDSSLKLENYEGYPVYLGLDLAEKTDIAALYILVQAGEDWLGFCKFWYPQANIDKGVSTTTSHLAKWAREGHLTLTPGSVIRHNWIEEEIKELVGKYDVRCVAFDAWHAHQLVSHLEDLRVKVVQVANVPKYITPALREVEGMISENGGFRHNNNPVMNWMMSNLQVAYDYKGNPFPKKQKGDDKIDGPMALLYAVTRVTVEEKSVKSIYDTWAANKSTQTAETRVH